MTQSKKDIINEYKMTRSSYKEFTKKLKKLISEILSSGPKYDQIQYRTKTLKSFEDKVERGDYKPEKCDKSGIRIVAVFNEEVDSIKNKIKKELWTINESDEREKKADVFGYQSVHLWIRLKENRRNLKEWSPYAKLVCEIQIRTILQHAWAAVSHELQYKKPDDVPNELKRKLNRNAGLLELVDEQFLEIKEKKSSITKTIKSLKKEDVVFYEKFDSGAKERWVLNFWGTNDPEKTNYLDNNQMIFEAKEEQLKLKDGFGAFIDLRNKIYSGHKYKICCKVKSIKDTTMKFQLWIHDITGGKPRSVNPESPEIPPIQEKDYCVNFKANDQNAMRIHLLCKGGDGRIIVNHLNVIRIG